MSFQLTKLGKAFGTPRARIAAISGNRGGRGRDALG